MFNAMFQKRVRGFYQVSKREEHWGFIVFERLETCSLQSRRDFLRTSGEQGRRRGKREASATARVACEGRFAKRSRLSPYHCSSCSGVQI